MALNKKVPHGIPVTRRTFKNWREFRERQRDSAQGTSNPKRRVIEML